MIDTATVYQLESSIYIIELFSAGHLEGPTYMGWFLPQWFLIRHSFAAGAIVIYINI